MILVIVCFKPPLLHISTLLLPQTLSWFSFLKCKVCFKGSCSWWLARGYAGGNGGSGEKWDLAFGSITLTQICYRLHVGLCSQNKSWWIDLLLSWKLGWLPKAMIRPTVLTTLERFSLAAKLTSVRLIISLVGSHHWPLHQLNIKNIFLHSD